MTVAPAGRLRRPGALRVAGSAVGGLSDAGLSALSTFLMGTAVVRLVGTADLALYSSLFAGFVVCALVPTQLVYVPAQLAANAQAGSDGRPVAPDVVRDLRSHLVVVIAAGVLTCVLGLPLAAQAGWGVYAAASVGMAVFAVASPHQTHARSVLHVVGRHRGAALVSACTLAVQVLLLVGVLWSSPTPALRPALLGLVLLCTGLANAAGVVVALVLLRHVPRMRPVVTPLRVRLGFLSAEGVAQAGAYVTVLIVAGVLGTQAVAALEAARVVASPVQVLVVGLLSFLIPSAVRAVSARRARAFVRTVRRIVVVVLAGGAGYVLLLALSGDAIGRLLGRHVQVDLASARAAMTAIDSTGAPSSMALLTRHRVVPVNVVAVVSTAVTLAVVPWTLLLLGAIGLPAAQAVAALVRIPALGLLTRRLFDADAPAAARAPEAATAER